MLGEHNYHETRGTRCHICLREGQEPVTAPEVLPGRSLEADITEGAGGFSWGLVSLARLPICARLTLLKEIYSQAIPWLPLHGEGFLEEVSSLRLRDAVVGQETKKGRPVQQEQSEQKQEYASWGHCTLK